MMPFSWLRQIACAKNRGFVRRTATAAHRNWLAATRVFHLLFSCPVIDVAQFKAHALGNLDRCYEGIKTYIKYIVNNKE